MIDFATFSDKTALCSMWEEIFREDREVTDLFFRNIFPKAVAPVIRKDEKIVSALFLLPCKIGSYKGRCVYCAMTLPQYRGKGYMKELLDFSYGCCNENGFDFLILIPAEKSLFDYYKKCGFEVFGHRKTYMTGNGGSGEPLSYDCSLEFDGETVGYWEKACIHYGGELIKGEGFCGAVFPDDVTIIRNAMGNVDCIPEKYRKKGVIIQGDISQGVLESPAMIKTENNKIKELKCFVGITLE